MGLLIYFAIFWRRGQTLIEIYMKRILTLLVLSCLAVGIVGATEQPLKRLSPVQLAQMRLKGLNEASAPNRSQALPGQKSVQAKVSKGQSVLPLSGKRLSKVTIPSWSVPVQVTGRDWSRLQSGREQVVARRQQAQTTTWIDEGNYDISWFDGSVRLYRLSTPEQLAGLAYLFSANYYVGNIDIRLEADVDMSAHEWVPIGTSQISFRGTFDGGGHTISGLHVTGQEYAGLFGYVRGGEIRNVMLASDCQISGNTAGSIVGSIDEEGVIENCYSEATVSGHTVGGLVGACNGTRVRLCVFNGRVSKFLPEKWSGNYLGYAPNGSDSSVSYGFQIGFVPRADYPDSLDISLTGTQMQLSYQFGGKVGSDGLLHIPLGQYVGSSDTWQLYLCALDGNTAFVDGEFLGTLSDDRRTVTLTTSQGNTFAVLMTEDGESLYLCESLLMPLSARLLSDDVSGALVGSGGYDWAYCYYSENSVTNANQVVGTALTDEEMQSSQLVDDLNEYVREVAPTQTEKRLNLWTSGGSGPALSTEVCPTSSWWDEGNYDTSWYDNTKTEFTLSTPAQLAGLSYLVYHTGLANGVTVRLGADIDLSAYRWMPIGIQTKDGARSFVGLFDGCGHTISGMQVDGVTYAGLFGYAEGAEICNLMLSSTCTVSGLTAGSIAGLISAGSITNCRSDATVYGHTAGGLAGNCINAMLLSSIFNGRVAAQGADSEWVGTYHASALSPFQGEEELELPLDVTISPSIDSADEYILSLYSTRAEMSYSMTGSLESDGKLHIPMGQMVGMYSNRYSLTLENETGASGEFVVTLSTDGNAITFTDENLVILISAYENGESVGYLDGWRLPITADRVAEAPRFGGLAGTFENEFVEHGYYRAGCLPEGVSDNEYALSQGELLSQAQVATMNEAVMTILEKDPWVESLSQWRQGANGPELSTEQQKATGWWISEGNYDISWYDESQTEFTLSTPAQLAGLSYLAYHSYDFTGKTVKLANDIDLSGHRWVPIGCNYRIFRGNIDGNGHAIHHMDVDVESYSSGRVGSAVLVGFIGYTFGEVRNITLADDCSVRIKIISSSQGMIGTVSGAFEGPSMDNCHSQASIEVNHAGYTESFIGGLLGFDGSYKPIYNSSSSGRIVAVSDHATIWVSGLAGVNARIINCFHVGDISGTGPDVHVGGICASYSNQTNVYHAGKLSATGVEVDGNPATVEISPLGNPTEFSLENGYYDVTCVADTTGLNAKGVAMQPDEMKRAEFAELLTANATSVMDSDPYSPTLSDWEIRAGENNGYPVLGGNIEVGGWWTSEGNYDASWYDESQTEFTLSTPAQLAGLAYLVKTGTTFEGKMVTLAGNIDLDGLKWEPIGSVDVAFRGTFDGGGYEIYNLHSEVISAYTAVAGLFGQLDQARVSHVVLADDCIVKSSTYGGGIAAYANNSTIVSCVNRASVELEAPYGYVGGIVGYATGSVVDLCENWGPVAGQVQITGNYSVYMAYTGGIGGYLDSSTILNCANSADVTVEGSTRDYSSVGGILGYSSQESSVVNCYNTGRISADELAYVGGISGHWIIAVRVANCYNVGVVSTTDGIVAPIAPQDANVENSYYESGCVVAGDYLGRALSADEMKTRTFAAGLNNWTRAYNATNTEHKAFYWMVDAAQNEGYPVLTEEGPGYSAIESTMSAQVRIYPTVVTSQLYVSGAEQPVYLYDLSGHTVSIVEPAEGLTVVDMSQLTQGLYLVRCGDRVERIIKR